MQHLCNTRTVKIASHPTAPSDGVLDFHSTIKYKHASPTVSQWMNNDLHFISLINLINLHGRSNLITLFFDKCKCSQRDHPAVKITKRSMSDIGSRSYYEHHDQVLLPIIDLHQAIKQVNFQRPNSIVVPYMMLTSTFFLFTLRLDWTSSQLLADGSLDVWVSKFTVLPVVIYTSLSMRGPFQANRHVWTPKYHWKLGLAI